MPIERYVSQAQQTQTLKSVSMLTMSSSEYYQEETRERKRDFIDYICKMITFGSFPFYCPQKTAYNTGYQ